ncbi:OmpP1/FadL family transporter [Chryseobacterium caseinilyticum]|nr:hemin receptor [Chryseobacterium caseinilyticum]
MSISAAFFVQAQDVSLIRNTLDVYSNSQIGGSARFNAMGGSNGALGGDANALLTNPAGLGVAISGEVSGTLSVMSNKNTSNYAGSSFGYKVNNADLGNVGGVMTFQLMTESAWKFVNIGVNFSNQSIDNYIETPGNSNIVFDFDANNSSALARHAYDRYGTLSKTSFGVGANYNHNLYIGMGLNFSNVSLDQSDTAALQSLQNGSVDYLSKQNTPYFERSSGFSASVGVIGKLGRNFRLGAAIETPTFWDIDRSYNFYNDPQFGDDYAVENRRLTSPMKATLSAAFVANKNFSMNLDYTLGLTKPSYKVYGGAERQLNDFFDQNQRSLSEVKLGAEYRVKQFRLRGGYSYTASPFDALTVSRYGANGTSGDPVDQSYNNMILGDRNALSFGLGYDFKSFYIDATFQNISSTFNNPLLFGVIDQTEGIEDGYYSPSRLISSSEYVVSDVKNVINNFYVTFGWKF